MEIETDNKKSVKGRKLSCLVIGEAVASTGQLMIRESRMCDNINWMGNW